MASAYRYFVDPGNHRNDDVFLLFYRGNLIARDGQFTWNRKQLPGSIDTDHVHLLISESGDARWLAVNLQTDISTDIQAQSVTLRQLLMTTDQQDFRLAGLGYQLINWYLTHQYCGRCGQTTSPHPQDRAVICEACNLTYFPRINPCVIVLVNDGNRVLLARNARYRTGMYSCLAGFIEAGETPEETVAREVMEETGIGVTNIRYVKSQSWPFPSQLMIGFFADYAEGEIAVDGIEIEEADWFPIDSLPEVPSPLISVAGELISQYVKSQQ